MAKDIYAEITNRIIEQLEAGVVAWRKPWIVGEAINLVSRKPYRGINALVLATSPFTSPYWVTFNQAKQLGGNVKKGAKGYPIVFWTTFEKEDEDGEQKSFPVLRSWTVFNVEQTEAIDYPPEITREFTPIEKADDILKNMPHKPGFTHLGGDRAYYSLDRDCVYLPHRELFVTEEEYYSVAFHELVHSTGHPSRLARELGNKFGSEKYSKEELIAEFGAAMLCGKSGIAPVTVENSAAYIDNWLQALKNDKKLLITAAAAAQKAADYILGEQAKTEAEDEAA